RRHARPGRPGRGRRPRPRARRRDPASAARPGRGGRRLAVRPSRRHDGCPSRPGVHVALLALDRAPARARPRGLRPVVGRPREARRDVAGRNVAGLATDVAGIVPADAAGPSGGPPRRRRAAGAPARGLIRCAPRRINAMQALTAIDAVVDDARRELPELRLLTEVADRESYRLDETAYLAAGLPGAVALPASTDEVSALLRL